ncbi:hypothetical protein ACH5RR_040177 [Cinchona calisaya]|uniref:Integrase catalytic domain-containing protein n=1 Tax=Cinchona calisaya TaxID=153742 RepID=A0ABD2XU75_9GENT
MEFYMRECDVCKRSKVDQCKNPRLLQPLLIPSQAWQHISMDFIKGLPRSASCNTIFVIIDRFTKYGHFFPITAYYIAQSVASVFFDNVYKLHGLPKTIVSNKDKVFTSLFWQELFGKLGTELHLSSAYHPQTDGQTERLNRCLQTYLRCLYFH